MQKQNKKYSTGNIKERGETKGKRTFCTRKISRENYGQYTFPEGIYDAVRIDLGAAKGTTGGVSCSQIYA